MTWRQYLLLALLGVIVAVMVAAFQSVPGYMDADYYYAGGMQLASGRGFTEPYLWNYLDDPAGLPHPSNAYWMPLASLLVAAGAALSGPSSWSGARIGFVALAACIPPVTAALAFSLTSRRGLALTSGLLAVFSGFYLRFLTTTDTFGLYMFLGGLFFIINGRKPSRLNPLLLGLVAGLMHLSRADGLLWLGIALFAVVVLTAVSNKNLPASYIFPVISCLAGYLLVMGPWMVRNFAVFGSPLAPGGSRSLWLTYYDQLFTYPASRLSFNSWWQSGIAAIVKVRLWALGMNLANVVAVQGEVFLLPLIGVGVWVLRKNRQVMMAVVAWALTLVAMTVVFPFAGARGGFFHSGAALQPFWWAVAPVGLERLIAWGVHRRGWAEGQARVFFQSAVVGALALMTVVITYQRVIGGFNGGPVWGQENAAYQRIGEFLSSQGAPADAVVIVANPPGFYLATGHPAIAVPDGNADTVRAIAERYQAQYLVLEKGGFPGSLGPLYQDPKGEAGLHYLGEVEEARVFVIRP